MQEKNSEFLNFILKNNLAKPLKEAFEEFPTQEEIHKGNPNYFLQEEKIIYSNYRVGDIVFVDEYLYNNMQKGTNHLFVIVEKNNIAVPIEYFEMILSSKIEKLKYDTNILIQKNGQNNLKKDSILKLDEIYQIYERNILFKIGEIELEKINEYKKIYIEILNNK